MRPSTLTKHRRASREDIAKYTDLASKCSRLAGPLANDLLDSALDGDHLARSTLEWLAGHAALHAKVVNVATQHIAERDKISMNSILPARLRFERMILDAKTDNLRTVLREAGANVGDEKWPTRTT